MAFTDYYEEDYANYYERPGTEPFHRQRYAAIWKWICEFSSPNKPKKILDIGCGQGWLMDQIKETFPEATIEGVEPSRYNVRVAEAKGYRTFEGRLEQIAPQLGTYDLIVSTNVLQHVSSPLSFIKTVSKLVADSGTIAITCPDGSRPNIELLWADQNLSLTPPNLQTLFRQASPSTHQFSIHQSQGNTTSLPPALMLIANNKQGPSLIHSTIDNKALLKARNEYLNSFRLIDQHLSDQIGENDLAVNFGASYWTSILAAYCPSYWSKVKFCCVDDPKGQTAFLDKPVIKTTELPASSRLILGTSPESQQSILASIIKRFPNTLSWEHFLPHANLQAQC